MEQFYPNERVFVKNLDYSVIIDKIEGDYVTLKRSSAFNIVKISNLRKCSHEQFLEELENMHSYKISLITDVENEDLNKKAKEIIEIILEMSLKDYCEVRGCEYQVSFEMLTPPHFLSFLMEMAGKKNEGHPTFIIRCSGPSSTLKEMIEEIKNISQIIVTTCVKFDIKPEKLKSFENIKSLFDYVNSFHEND